MNAEFKCSDCNTEYLLIIGSGFPLVYVTEKTHSSMNECCKYLHRKWAAHNHDIWYHGARFEDDIDFVWSRPNE